MIGWRSDHQNHPGSIISSKTNHRFLRNVLLMLVFIIFSDELHVSLRKIKLFSVKRNSSAKNDPNNSAIIHLRTLKLFQTFGRFFEECNQTVAGPH